MMYLKGSNVFVVFCCDVIEVYCILLLLYYKDFFNQDLPLFLCNNFFMILLLSSSKPQEMWMQLGFFTDSAFRVESQSGQVET